MVAILATIKELGRFGFCLSPSSFSSSIEIVKKKRCAIETKKKKNTYYLVLWPQMSFFKRSFSKLALDFYNNHGPRNLLFQSAQILPANVRKWSERENGARETEKLL